VIQLIPFYLKFIKNHLKAKDRRWKIEHAQVVQESDFDYFKLGIIPSVQPTQHLICIGLRSSRKDRLKTHMLIKNYFKKAGVIAWELIFP
jgi:predicted amidohydrolase YtcJ